MNNRIKELITQAGGRVKSVCYGHGDYRNDLQLSNEEIDKFAELLVKECIEVLEKRHQNFKGTGGEYGRGFRSGLEAATSTVKVRFGVEK